METLMSLKPRRQDMGVENRNCLPMAVFRTPVNWQVRRGILAALASSVYAARLWASPASAAIDLTISAEDKRPCPIVIASEAPASERYAAEQLQSYIEEITGVKLPVVQDSALPLNREIILGENAHLRQLGIEADVNKLG